jgi:hypothetical protein
VWGDKLFNIAMPSKTMAASAAMAMTETTVEETSYCRDRVGNDKDALSVQGSDLREATESLHF